MTHLLFRGCPPIEARDINVSHHPVEAFCDNTSDGRGG